MNIGGASSDDGSGRSVRTQLEVDELLEEAQVQGFETSKQSVLKGLVCQ